MRVLTTERLTLRPFTLADAPAVQSLVSAYEVALNTRSIPHPYPEGGAEAWIATHDVEFRENRAHVFAIDDGQVVGGIDLILRGDGVGEVGYWIGVPFWGRGYATEALKAVIGHGFENLGLRRIFACHFGRNAASGRVMQKAGMTCEGTLRQHLMKWDEPVDLVFYGVLREEWTPARPAALAAPPSGT